ncbi:MAG: hypothetical protein WC878_07430 [Candidatus Paceibacterota bacterium]|jgi:hypothetical protein
MSWFNFNKESGAGKEEKKKIEDIEEEKGPEEEEKMEEEIREEGIHTVTREALATRDKGYRDTNEKLDVKNEVEKLARKLQNSEKADIKNAAAVLMILSRSILKGKALDLADSVLKLPLSQDTRKKTGEILYEGGTRPGDEEEQELPQTAPETTEKPDIGNEISDLAQKLKNSEDADLKSAAVILAVLSQSLKEGNTLELANSISQM